MILQKFLCFQLFIGCPKVNVSKNALRLLQMELRAMDSMLEMRKA